MDPTLERYRKLGLKLSQPIMNGRLFVCPLNQKFLKKKMVDRIKFYVIALSVMIF